MYFDLYKSNNLSFIARIDPGAGSSLVYSLSLPCLPLYNKSLIASFSKSNLLPLAFLAPLVAALSALSSSASKSSSCSLSTELISFLILSLTFVILIFVYVFLMNKLDKKFDVDEN